MIFAIKNNRKRKGVLMQSEKEPSESYAEKFRVALKKAQKDGAAEANGLKMEVVADAVKIQATTVKHLPFVDVYNDNSYKAIKAIRELGLRAYVSYDPPGVRAVVVPIDMRKIFWK